MIIEIIIILLIIVYILSIFGNKPKIYEEVSENISEQIHKKYIDENGYYRFTNNNKLEHRDIAYLYIYRKNRHKYPLRFSVYQVHHINENKLDNNVNNLQIVTESEHEKIHGITKIYKEWSNCSCLDKYGQQVRPCSDCGNHRYKPKCL
jgi:hypothetical protein